jgi:RHS repeat-associated protein
MLGSSRTTPSTSTAASDTAAASDNDTFGIRVPSISLPKGGGAIRGTGEKFGVNPVTGTGATTVPIATSQGRAGFGPRLELTYNSGEGDGPFGIGWQLTLPAITLRTDRGRPRYAGDDADVPVLAGAEDLVPVLIRGANANWDFEQLRPRVIGGRTYRIRRYRPRVEGTFAWIERWTRDGDRTDTFWRTISRDNVTTWFGRTAESRIADPADLTRIFSWLPCETYDDKGNVAVYRYRAEDSTGVDAALASERNRTAESRSANRYLKRILYGNHVPYLPRLTATDPWPAPPGAAADASASWYFEVVLDYGEHDATAPTPSDTGAWATRPDPFSTYRGGFEVRTYRLCRRVLMFHHVDGEPGVGRNCLVRSTTFAYSTDAPPTDPSAPRHSQLRSVTAAGFVRQGAGYLTRSLPPLEFEYSQATIDDTVRELDAAALDGLPAGVDGARYQWVDLDGEGVPGVVTEQDGGWFYKRNLSPAPVPGSESRPRVRLSAAERVATIPSRSALSAGQQLVDLAGDGQLDVVAFDGPAPGFFERGEVDGWDSFRPFRCLPNLPWRDPNVRLVDLTGDGLADVLVTADDGFTWYPSLGEDGFGPPKAAAPAVDEERGPRRLATTQREAIYLSDMSGDGASDIVRVGNAEVCYWPNLGYGRFGPKVTMDRAPWLDEPDQFDPKRLRLADIDGSGTVDLLYLGRTGVDVYSNESGNGWTAPRRLTQFPKIDDLSSVSTVDLLGNGTVCLVWSSPLPGDRQTPVRYIDLMGGRKPHLLVRTRNNLGAETTIDYAPSTKFYVADRLAGRPWATRLPFPVHVVERVTARDRWCKTAFSSTYSYHHGYFDGVEREFRGFARVEQLDVEDFDTFATANAASPYVTADRRLYQPPVKSVSWFETGAAIGRQRMLDQLCEEYFPRSVMSGTAAKQLAGGFAERELPAPDLGSLDLSAEEWREALRACRGMAVRQEVYELDVDALHERGEHVPVRLFSAASRTADVQRLQPKAGNQHAVFLVTESEAVTYQYELDLRPATLRPDPRVSHTLNLRTDGLGNVQQAISVGYPRQGRHEDANLTAAQLATIREVQAERHVGYAETRHTTDVLPASADRDSHRLRVPYEVRSYELTGIRPTSADGYFSAADLRAYLLSADLQPAAAPDPAAGYLPVGEIAYHEVATKAGPQKRLIEHVRTLFFRDDLQAPLPLGQQGRLGLSFEAYKLALTGALLKAVFGSKLSDVVDGAVTAQGKLDDPSVSGYVSGGALVGRFAPRVPAAELAGQYWVRSGTAGFAPDAAQHFYLPERYVDAFGNVTQLRFDRRDLYVEQSTDPVGNTMSIESFDWRVLAPRRLKDINDNLSEVVFDALGLVVAVAVMGKGTEADDLTGFTDAVMNPDPRTVAAFCTSATMDEATARGWLRRASRRFVYHFGEARSVNGAVTGWAARPAAACSIQREIHAAAPGGARSPLQVALECSDGSGGVLMQKTQAEPEAPGGALRWIVAGKTVLNNKGKPVKQYEPYFSPSFGCEAVDERGVTPLLYYDAVGRLIRTEFPDGTFSRVEFSPWSTASHDPNDTVLEPGNPWYARTSASTAPPKQQRAATAAAEHAGTPSITAHDALGRDVIGIEHNRYTDESGVKQNKRYLTFTKLDVEGKPLWIRDPRGNLPVQYIAPAMAGGRADDVTSGYVTCYDVAGNLLFQHGMDSGDRWMLPDAMRQPIVVWDVNERRDTAGQVMSESRVFLHRYDALRRPLERWCSQDGGPRRLVERFVSGETVAGATNRNLRGQLYRHYDSSGRMQFDRFDFKGNRRETSRRLCLDYRDAATDWQTDPDDQLEAATFVQAAEYDALNRPTRRFAWHRGTGARVAVHLPRYNERGALVSHDVVAHATKTASGFSVTTGYPRTTVVRHIAYNARGQVESIEYGNGSLTRYDYDPERFRLVQLRTTRSGFDPPFPTPSTAAADARILQNLFYTYDAAGNITEVWDAAFTPAFFRNQQVDPVSRYRYDSCYRLIEATGRENYNFTSAPRQIESDPAVAQFPVTDPTALRNYTERYEYDASGNIVRVRHIANRGSWTRHYGYAKTSNRLQRTWRGSNVGAAIAYRYDAHGNTLNVANTPPAADLSWDYRDALKSVDLGGGGRAHYVYDADKQRTRKVIESPAGVKRWERLYLDDVEIYRRYRAGGVVADEIESHSILVEDRRVLLLDDVISATSAGLVAGVLSRYQYNNHLGSSCLELDASSQVISYEEFHPYGTSAYQARGAAIKASSRRYRYTACERDTETGFDYHGARFYVAWLGRWLSCDPSGLADGLNLYSMAHGNPVCRTDTNGRESRSEAKPEAKVVMKMLAGLANATVVEEFAFRFTDPKTGKKGKGRFDLTVGPKNEFMNLTVFLEAKVSPGSRKTDPQKIYLPLFEKGLEVEIVSRKASVVGLKRGQKITIKTGQNFALIHGENVGDFQLGAKAVYQSQPGVLKQYGEKTWFEPAESWEKLQQELKLSSGPEQKQGQRTVVGKPPALNVIEEITREASAPSSTLGQRLGSPGGREALGNVFALLAGGLISRASSASAATAQRESTEALQKQAPKIEKYLADNPTKGVLLVSTFRTGTLPESYTYTQFVGHDPLEGFESEAAARSYYERTPKWGLPLQAWTGESEPREYRWIPSLATRTITVIAPR